MKGNLFNIVAFATPGLITGYASFGKWAGDYDSLKMLFSLGGNVFQNAFCSISGIEDMRNKILLCGVAGACVIYSPNCIRLT